MSSLPFVDGFEFRALEDIPAGFVTPDQVKNRISRPTTAEPVEINYVQFDDAPQTMKSHLEEKQEALRQRKWHP